MAHILPINETPPGSVLDWQNFSVHHIHIHTHTTHNTHNTHTKVFIILYNIYIDQQQTTTTKKQQNIYIYLGLYNNKRGNPPPKQLYIYIYIDKIITKIIITSHRIGGVSRNQRFQDINAMKEDKTMLKKTF